MIRRAFRYSFAVPLVGDGPGNGGGPSFRRFSWPFVTLVILFAGLSAIIMVAGTVYFSSQGSDESPTISILQPQGTLTLASGQGFVLLAEARAEGGVQRIDLLVDGTVVEQRIASSPGESPLQAAFPWFSTGIGVHELGVVAYDARGRASAPMVLQVGVETADISQIFPSVASAGEQEAPGSNEGMDGDPGAASLGVSAPDPAPAGESHQGDAFANAAGQPLGEGDNIDDAAVPDEEANRAPEEDQIDRPPILDPAGEIQDVERPLVNLEIEQQPGEATILISATATDNVGLAGIRLRIQGGAGQVPIIYSQMCGEQPRCEIAPPPFEQQLSPGEWVLLLQAWDVAGNSSNPRFDRIDIICNQGDPCAMADHDGGDWGANIPPGAIIDPESLIMEIVLAPPSAPSDLDGLSFSCNDGGCSISLNWVDNSENETGFRILRDGQVLTVTAADARQYLDRPVPLGDQYAYVVRAFNDWGESPVSNNVVIMAGDRASPATDLTGSPWCGVPQGCEVTLSWMDNADNETGFRILRDDEVIGSVEAGETGYLDRDVVGGEEYTYKVQVFNNSGSSVASNEVVVIVDNLPRAPSNLTAQSFCRAPAGCLIELRWADNSNDETGFLILRDGQLYDTQIADVTRYDDSRAEPGRQYAYAVKAFNDIGQSPASNTVGLGLGNASYSISGQVRSECPSDRGPGLGNPNYQTCLTAWGPCWDSAGPACSPGTLHPYDAEGVSIELAQCNGSRQRIPDGEFVWAGGGGHPCDGNATPLSITHTDGDGYFIFEGLGPGIYQVRPLGLGWPGIFAAETDNFLDYSMRVAYVGINDQSEVVWFKSVMANQWTCGYVIEPEPYDLLVDDLYESTCQGYLEP